LADLSPKPFFNNDWSAYAVKNGLRLRELVEP